MGQIHRTGEEYYIEFTARGLLYQQKAGKDFKKAQELLLSIEEKIANGELQAVSRDLDLDIFYVEFLKYAKTQNHPLTLRRLSAAVEHFGEYIRTHKPDVIKLSQVPPRVIEDYKTFGIQQRKDLMDALNPKVINLTLMLVREMFEYGIKTGFINDNPTLHVRLLDVAPSKRFQLSDVQFITILDHAAQPFKDMMILMRYTGLRAHEILDLTWQQVDLNKNIIFVKLREVPIMPQALAIFKDRFRVVIDHKARVFDGPDGKRFELSDMVQSFEQATIASGLPLIPLAVLRYAFASDLFQRRISLLSIGKMLGVYDVVKLMLFSCCMPVRREGIAP